ncbi:gonadotropin-releasing hormone 3 [Narcine bancroftii]|uniref:gonadotropin-releasing hormone 3 n=1 Tax=Narcine bancroftii TaxID=1343680 RepID=UPI00383194DA
MEIFKITFMNFLIAMVFVAQSCQSQHWSHGWLPGGKRNAVGMDAHVEMINDEDVVAEVEIPGFQYLYKKMNSPHVIIPAINDRNLQGKQKLEPNFQETID